MPIPGILDRDAIKECMSLFNCPRKSNFLFDKNISIIIIIAELNYKILSKVTVIILIGAFGRGVEV